MLKKRKAILIVGGTGFIGYHLAIFCKNKNLKVTVISSNSPPKKRFIRGVKYLKCNISKKINFRALKNCNFNYVVNLGGYVDHKNKVKTHLSHFIGVKNLADFFLSKKIDTFVQMSTGGEYGNQKSPHKERQRCKPNSVYSRAKYLATNYLLRLFKKNKFPCIILRLYQAYGPGQDVNRFLPTLITNCIKNSTFKTSHGKQYRDFIYINDLILVIYKCLKTKSARGEILNVGSGKPLNIKKIIYKSIKLCKGGKPKFGEIALRKEENLITYPSLIKIKKILSWKPMVNFDKGFKITVNSYKKLV
jgi:nucleoside-diphosphate-sugar epimerase